MLVADVYTFSRSGTILFPENIMKSVIAILKAYFLFDSNKARLKIWAEVQFFQLKVSTDILIRNIYKTKIKLLCRSHVTSSNQTQ